MQAYQMPEKRSFRMIVIDRAKIASQINIDDEELRRAYDMNRERYRTGERVRVRHILLKTTEVPEADRPKIKARAEELLKQVRGGGDFAELARKHSQDPGSAIKGGDLDWVLRGQTVKPFEDAAFSLKPNEISGVIETQYGYHILQVLEKEAAKVRPFEEVKDELAGERRSQAVNDRMQDVADQVRAELSRNPQNADQIAQKFGVTVIRVEEAGAGDPLPEIGAGAEVHSAVAATGKGEVTPVIQVGEDRLIAAVVDNITPARQANFAEVEQRVRDAYIAEKAAEIARQKAAEAAEKAKAAGGDLRSIAKAYGVEIKSPPAFGRDAAVEGIGPSSYFLEAFNKEAGALLNPVNLGDTTYIAKVTKREAADMSKLPAERETLVTAIKGRKARERDELFKEGLLSELVREGKVKIHDDTVKRLVASYRG
jgi:peptidyl-prolyl cis-trans isomerase D